jgi:nickel-dependent lactate racemase
MRIKFPYPDFSPLKIKKSSLLGLWEPGEMISQKSPEHILKEALANPISSPPLSRLAQGKQNVLIAVDDYTRTTPAATILPLALEELNSAALKDDSISIILAGGSHRSMTDEEVESKLGAGLRSKFKVLLHDRKNQGELENIGELHGSPLKIREEAASADLIVGVGHIAPHGVAGFFGGAKIIFPGLSDHAFTSLTHWLSVQHSQKEIIGKRDNPVRSFIDEAASFTSLKFIVNTISDAAGNLAGAVAGDPVAAHQEGAEISLGLRSVNLPFSPDVLIIDSYPADADLWQAAKAIYAAEVAARPGGVVIWVTPAREGIPGYLKEQFLARGYLPLKQAQEMYEQGEVGDLIVHAHLARVGRLVRDKATTIIVSPGISAEEAEQMGLLWAEGPQQALDRALAIMGQEASVGVIRSGGEILPMVQG